MQEFLTNNIVTWNLISLTGYRALVILEALIESPKNYDELIDYLRKNQYTKDSFSKDTIRIDLNSLRAVGCEILSATKSSNKKYTLLYHPFGYEITKKQINALKKFYKSIYTKIDINDVLAIERLILKLGTYLQNRQIFEKLLGISLLKNINIDMLNSLNYYCKTKSQLLIRYHSPKSGDKDIEIIADKLLIKSEKLYLCGKSLDHNEYSFFLLNRIVKILDIKLFNEKLDTIQTTVIYELYSKSYVLEDFEKIIYSDSNKIVVSADVKNDFMFMQRLLYFGSDCKLIEPLEYKEKFVAKLKAMEEIYG